MSQLIVEVCRVNEVKVHPNADALELAVVKGWQAVVPKGKFRAGDKVVYIPPDSVLPVELSDRLGITKYLSNGRVRCAKLRGEPSFGVVMDCADTWVDGAEVSELLHITKYEPPVKTDAGDAEQNHPLFTCYTDIENLRNFPDVLRTGEEVVVTEKIHGTNCRVGWVRDEGGAMIPVAGSKGLRRKMPDSVEAAATNLYWFPTTIPEVDELMDYIMEKPGVNQVILFGEVYGKVQSLRYGLDNGIAFRAFDLMVDGHYLNYAEFGDLCSACGVQVAPVLYHGPFDLPTVKRLAEGRTTIGDATHVREGVVVKPTVERTDPKVGRVILKYVGDGYLLGKDISDATDL